MLAAWRVSGAVCSSRLGLREHSKQRADTGCTDQRYADNFKRTPISPEAARLFAAVNGSV
jgi:hypothetical protein